ncbi:TerB family tellurite resistance protein [Coralliovum pocilloporae]|uniref:tellurite resistance TerB family protein n=1 Tax=Coralliovum pocilloporae TaxID=3066369 RepID=UPI0033071C63
MFDALKQFIDRLSGQPHDSAFADDDHRLAAAALLVHASSVDGVVSGSEREKIKTLLMERFGLGPAETDELITEARDKELEAVDLYGFTTVLKRNLDEEGREKVIGMLWDLVYADGIVHEFEDNLVWRVAELLGVSGRDRMRLRWQAESRSEIAEDPE